MTERQVERAAYIAAHRILEADMSAPNLVCDGAIRTHAVDTIAQIICEAMDLERRVLDLRGFDGANAGALIAGTGASGLGKYRTAGPTSATVLQMPSRTSA